MSIPPNVAAIIKIVLGILTAIATGGLSFTGILDPAQCATLVAVCSSLIVIIGIVMSGFSSSAPGILSPQDPPVVVAATAVANLPSNANPATIAQTKAAATAAVVAHQP